MFTGPDEGLGSSARHYGSGSLGSGSAGSVYLSDSQDWVVSPSCSPPDEGPVHHNAVSPMLAEETFRYMSKCLIITSILKLHTGGRSCCVPSTAVPFCQLSCNWSNVWLTRTVGQKASDALAIFFCTVRERASWMIKGIW